MDVLLVKPAWFVKGAYEKCRLARVPPLNLGIIAALSKNCNVRIVDLDVEPIEYSPDWDLVGISVATSTAIQAYQIADNFRQMGVRVVLGGVHGSLLKEEALQHADALVIGEAEKAWPKILQDFPKLNRVYQETELVNMDEVPFPLRDLYHNSYVTDSVQMTRGCTYDCNFCYLQKVPWKKYRKRSPFLIAQEFEQIRNKFILVVDDNLFVDKRYVANVANEIQCFKKFWSVQAPLSLGLDKILLKKLSKAGLVSVALGVDSFFNKSLVWADKSQNTESNIKSVVRNFHDAGIAVSVFLVFGFDTDSEEVFKKSIEIMHKANIDSGVFFILTPYPGTDLFDKYDKEKRIITKDWSKYNWLHSVFEPKTMSIQALETNTLNMYKEMRKMRVMHFYQTIPTAFNLIKKSFKLAYYMKDYLLINPNKY